MFNFENPRCYSLLHIFLNEVPRADCCPQVPFSLCGYGHSGVSEKLCGFCKVVFLDYEPCFGRIGVIPIFRANSCDVVPPGLEVV